MSIVLGIDPGVNGALALYGQNDRLIGVVDMPTLAAEGAKGRRIIDGPALLRLLRRIADKHLGLGACLEEVRSMPRDGHVGAFSFGRGFGTIETALAAVGIPYATVRPQVWKKKIGVTADKDQARAIASRLLPEGAGLWPLKKHDGRAEAALIALYGARENVV